MSLCLVALVMLVADAREGFATESQAAHAANEQEATPEQSKPSETATKDSDDERATRPNVVVPRMESPPKLESFLEMKAGPEVAGRMVKIDGFTQVKPKDGAPPSFPTEAYMGYDERNLYIVLVAFDSQPKDIRATMSKREAPGFFNDDFLEFRLDTFDDHRRSYYFAVNPYGIQADALWPEGEGGYDQSFDTLWYSHGQITKQGYVVLLSIPFKSLRFSAASKQVWGFYFGRVIPRLSEGNGWPRLTTRISSFLRQTARLEGLENISPGRNIQLIPYGIFRTFSELDQRDPARPAFVNRTAATQFGLDAKVVLKDSFVLDVTANPDFSQVESDDPQATVNQRFEVFFPEKRPFFLENANYFQTPINLVFTRRIVNPKFGVRLTGKSGPYALGVLVADDESPGKTVPANSPLAGQRAYFGIARVTRDVLKQSTLGLIYTYRGLSGNYNHVGGVDGRFTLNENWSLDFQAVASSTKGFSGARLSGSALDFHLDRTGRQFNYTLTYNDRSPGFRTAVGFEPRVDIRRLSQDASYRWRPEGRALIAWGPNVNLTTVWDHSGTRLDQILVPSLTWEFARGTNLTVGYSEGRERLRPQDFSNITANRDFSPRSTNFSFSSNYFPKLSFQVEHIRGSRINFVTPENQPPLLARSRFTSVNVTLRPFTRLQLDNTYLESRLIDRADGGPVLTDRILRSRINWQFNRKLSLRLIPQYNSLSVNSQRTSLEAVRNFNADALLAYTVNPWTSLFVGYNSNLQNLALVPTGDRMRVERVERGFLNDSKQFYVKFSYLLRF